MPLKDLWKIASDRKKQKETPNQVSFVNLIDKFIYQEQLALMKGKLKSADVLKQNARTAYLLTKRRYLKTKKMVSDYRDVYFHPSAMSACARRTFFSRFKAPKDSMMREAIPDVSRTIRIFANGDDLHLRMQVLFIRMGLCTLDDIEVPFQTEDEQGTADAIPTVEGQKFVVDFKSINERLFMKLRREGIDEGYEMQIRTYMRHFKIPRGVFIYECKNNQALHEVLVLADEKRDQDVLDRLDYLRTAVKNKNLPEKEGDDPERSPCSYCHFGALCWSDGKELKQWMRSLKA